MHTFQIFQFVSVSELIMLFWFWKNILLTAHLYSATVWQSKNLYFVVPQSNKAILYSFANISVTLRKYLVEPGGRKAITVHYQIEYKCNVCSSSSTDHKSKQHSVNFRNEKIQKKIPIDNHHQGSYSPCSSLPQNAYKIIIKTKKSRIQI